MPALYVERRLGSVLPAIRERYELRRRRVQLEEMKKIAGE
jgi:hypothetical protein